MQSGMPAVPDRQNRNRSLMSTQNIQEIFIAQYCLKCLRFIKHIKMLTHIFHILLDFTQRSTMRAPHLLTTSSQCTRHLKLHHWLHPTRCISCHVTFSRDSVINATLTEIFHDLCPSIPILLIIQCLQLQHLQLLKSKSLEHYLLPAYKMLCKNTYLA